MAVDDFDGFDEAYSPDDFSQADMDFATAVGMQTAGRGSESDSAAQFIANQFAQPQAGMNRSNVRNMANYDPTFAAALDISRGLDPTFNFQGTGGLSVPSYLRPQIESGRVDARGEPIRYSSEFERVLQEDVSDAIRSSQQAVAGIPSLISSGLGAIKSVFDGLSFLNDSKAGKTVEETADDQKRIEIANLEEQRQNQLTDPSFVARPIDTVTKTALDTLGAPLSGPPRFIEFSRSPARTITPDGLGLEEVTGRLDYPGFENDRDTSALVVAGTNLSPNQFRNANIPPTPVMVNPIQRDIARSRGLGINTLPQAADLQNQQIAAGEKTGQSLVDAPSPPPRKSDVFPMSGGFIMSRLSSDPTSILEELRNADSTANLRNKPRDPSNLAGTTLTMPDSVKDSAEAPPGFVDITLREGETPTYAGTNMTIFGGRDPSAKLYSPLTEAEARATTDAGFYLEPISQDLTGSTGGSGLTAVNLPGANFRVVRGDDPDPVVRVPISSLPKQAQQVAALRSGDLDYGRSFPLQSILDAKRQKEIRESQEDFQKFIKSLRSKAPIRVGGGYGGPQIDVVPSYAKNFPPSLSPLY